MEQVVTYSEAVRQNYDPTHTTTLRNAFARDMKRRFREIVGAIKIGVDKRDCFGLKEKIHTLQVTPPAEEAFAFVRSSAKVSGFMKWLNQQVEKGLLTVAELEQVGASVEAVWMNLYLFDAYKRGIIRARYEMRNAGMDIPPIEEQGGIGMVMGLPMHIDRLGLIYTRAYTTLKEITDAMDNVISQILAQGLAEGDGPALLARKLVAAIDGTGLGKLGITDSIGRFIPAQRRADMLARTEIIRAHHLATIQEYRNFGALKIHLKAEWNTGKDDRVCPICAAREGKVYTLDEAEGMIPAHPNCFIDPQIPIYTSEGWKPIGQIKVGDLVLTHKRRFRRVYALPRHNEKADVTTLRFKGTLQQISMTSNHPIFMSDGNWKDAGLCKPGDSVMVLGNVCKRCGKPTPYFKKYCSRTCLSKDITDKQWSDPNHRKIVSKKNRESMIHQYKSGERNGDLITKKAHEKIQQMVKEGNHPFQRPEVRDVIKQVTNLPKHRKSSSERMKKNNPMHDPVIVEKAKRSMKEFYINNPERRLNALMANHRKSANMTWIEKRMSELLDKMGIQYVYQYPILNYNVDFAIPGLKIAIECDGEYWHQDKAKDDIRDRRIEKEGWSVLHYTGTKINQCLNDIEYELSRVLCNHLGEYDLVPYKIDSVKNWTLSRSMPMYNLSVEEDESYVAKGIVVHNCRCIFLPWSERLLEYEK